MGPLTKESKNGSIYKRSVGLEQIRDVDGALMNEVQRRAGDCRRSEGKL